VPKINLQGLDHQAILTALYGDILHDCSSIVNDLCFKYDVNHQDFDLTKFVKTDNNQEREYLVEQLQENYKYIHMTWK
jgi:hypothetical protein